MDFLINFVETVDWAKIGESCYTAIVNIDWQGIVVRLSRLAGDLFGAFCSLIFGFIKDAVLNIANYFYDEIEACGGDIVSGLFKGIGDALFNLGEWIYDNIAVPFIEGFKKCFGIHSPSTVMAELGGYIIEGLKNGIEAGIKFIKDTFETILSVIKKVFVGIGNWFGETFSGAWNKIKGAFKGTKDFFASIWNSVKDVTVSILKEIVDCFKAPINGIITIVNGMITGIEKGINFIINSLNKLSFDVPDWVPGIGGKTFGFNLQEVEMDTIPLLAQGGYVKANTPQLAMIGDNKKEGEIIAPESKIAEAVARGIQSIIPYLVGAIGVRATGTPQTESVPINVYIGNDKLDSYILKAGQRQTKRSGGKI